MAILVTGGVGYIGSHTCIESFFSYLKTEIQEELKQAKNLEEAKKVIDEFIHYYNHKRIQGTLDYQTPSQYVAAC